MIRPLLATITLLAAVGAQHQDRELMDVVRNNEAEPAARCAALFALQERETLAGRLLVYALAQDATVLQDTACAILRHEWLTWPRELRVAIDSDPVARRAVLRELAQGWRRAADPWVAGLSRNEQLEPGDRLLALTARIDPPDRHEARFVVDQLVSGGGSEAGWAAARVPTEIADRLVGYVHSRLAGGAGADRLWPILDRMSAKGTAQLLGLAVTLERDQALSLYEHLARREDPGYRERVRAAVDGEIPLEEAWLVRAGPLLTTQTRRERVAAVLRDEAQSVNLRLRAFDALCEGGVYCDGLAEFAAGDGNRWRRLFQAEMELPEAVLLRGLELDSPALARALPGLSRRSLSLPAQRRLMQLLDGMDVDLAGPEGLMAQNLARLLVEKAADEGVKAALDAARDNPGLLRQLYDELAQRQDPAARTALLLERADPMYARDEPQSVALRNHLALVLAETGDRRELDELVRNAQSQSAAHVRRCRHAVPDLVEAHSLELLEQLPDVEDPMVRVEVLLWIGSSPLPAVRRELQRRWQEADDEEERDAALRGLMAGGERAAMLTELAGDGDMAEATRQMLAFAAVGSMPERLGDGDLELLRYLLFEEPQRDPAAEQARARRFPDGRAGFPLVAAIADRLRRDPAAAARVCEDAEAMAARGDTDGLTRQRLLCLWTALQAQPQARTAAARATAALLLAIDDDAETGAGPAHYYLGQQLAQRGDHAAAAAAFGRAAHRLLLLPGDRLAARIHLGSRDSAEDYDPYAALAARRHLELAEVALEQGDMPAAQRAAEAAREIAGPDAATLAAVAAILQRIPR